MTVYMAVAAGLLLLVDGEVSVPFILGDGLGCAGRIYPRGRTRPEPAPAEFLDGDSPAGALHRICRDGGPVFVRARGALDPDAGSARRTGRSPWILFGVGGPRPRHHPGRVLGVRRAGMGRVLGLGSGRELLAHSVDHRHRARPYGASRSGARASIVRTNHLARRCRLRVRRVQHVPDAERHPRRCVGALVHRSGLHGLLRCCSDFWCCSALPAVALMLAPLEGVRGAGGGRWIPHPRDWRSASGPWSS